MREQETARRHPHKALTVREVQAIREPGRHADGGGLYLLVAPGGSKSWMLRTVVMGKRRDIGLGSVELVSLAEAREEARRLRKIARDDGDPLAERRRRVVPTFEVAATDVHKAHSTAFKNAKHSKQWLSSLVDYSRGPARQNRQLAPSSVPNQEQEQMKGQGQVPNPDDMATCRQCEQLFDMNESESEDRCPSCVRSRCVKCGGPFGGKAIIRKNLDPVQWEFTCSLTGVRISFEEAMRERGLCRSCTDRSCRGCGDASVEPPDTKCDWCREPDDSEALIEVPDEDEDEDQNEDEDDGYVCPSCGAFDGYVRANIDSLNHPIPVAGPERSPGYCEVCDWRDQCPNCGGSEGFLPELICIPGDVYLAAHCTACGWHDVEGEKAVEQKRNIWGPRHAQWTAEQSAAIAERTLGVTPPSCRVCEKPMEFRFGLNEVNDIYLCSDYRDEAHRVYVGKDRHIDADKWIAEQRARQGLTPVDLSQPVSTTGSSLPPREPEAWASMEVLAGHLGVAKDTVCRWIDRRCLPAHRIGLVWKCKLSEVDAWVRNGGAADDSNESEGQPHLGNSK